MQRKTPALDPDRGFRGIFLFLLLFLSLWPSLLLAQDKPISAFYRETWTTREGLPHNQVNGIAQTPDGYLWLATWEGLVRYNGLEFQLFDRSNTPELKDNALRSVRASADGAVVIGTSRGGVTVKRGDHWQTFSKKDGLAQDEIMDALLDRKGGLWVATENEGISYLANGRATQYNTDHGLPNNVVFGLLEDADGSIWAATAAGVAHIVNDQIQVITAASGLPNAPAFVLFKTAKGELLIGTERGVYRRLGDQDRFAPLSPLLPIDGVPSLAEDGKGNLWVGTINNGLLRLSKSGVDRYASQRGLPNNRVPSLLVDREGSIWAGTNAGLLRLSDAPFTTWNEDQGLTDSYVRTVLEAHDGGIWIGTGRGLNLWRNNKIVARYTKASGLPSDSILSLLESRDGSLLIGSYTDGVLRMRDGKVVARYDNAHGMPGSNQVRALVENADGTLWIGTTRGLVRMREGHFQLFGAAQGMPREFIMSLHAARDGSLWVGTSNGVARIVGDKVEPLDMRAMYGAQDVFGFHEDADGTMWMATDRGLLRYRKGKLRGLGLSNGLPVDTFFAVVDDQQGNFWLTSNRGVLRIARKEIADVFAGKQQIVALDRFGEADGLASAQCNGGSGPSALLDRHGNFWVATARGAAVASPQSLHAFRHPLPHVVLEQVLADGKLIPQKQLAHLPPGTQKLEFRYIAPSFLMARFLRYRHRLQDVDADWVTRGNQRIAQYTNLKAGNYRFQIDVSAPGLGQGWSNNSRSIQIKIAPQLWERPAVIVAAILLLILLLYFLSRWRSAGLRRRAEQLEMVVAQRTRELRANADKLRDSDREKTALLGKLQEQAEAFERQAREDWLTGLANRRWMDECLLPAFERALAANQPLSFALIDIDHFKRINDEYSHAAGDRALTEIARSMREALPAGTMLARWGGEEFAVLLEGVALQEAHQLCERLRAAVEQLDCSHIAPQLKMTISIGVAERSDFPHYERMVSVADALLYEAKRTGRNRLCA